MRCKIIGAQTWRRGPPILGVFVVTMGRGLVWMWVRAGDKQMAQDIQSSEVLRRSARSVRRHYIHHRK
jgi:hypothetical protein